MGLLRVALALAVLLSHLPPATFKFMGGSLAVQGFFIVSGFYMSLVLSGKYSDTGLFYSNRLLRLLPTYFVMMAIAAVVLFGFKASATADVPTIAAVYSHPLTGLFFVIENLILVGQDLLYWFKIDTVTGAIPFDAMNTPPTETTPFAWQALLVPQSWSLSLELMFYAIVPFLARLRWYWIALIAAASIALRYAGHLLPVDFGLWQGRFFPTVLFLFLLGMLAHRALPLIARTPRWIGYFALAAVLAVVVFLPMLKPPREVAYWLVYLSIAIGTPFIFRAFRDHAFDRWIGDLSYPIYLSHLVVIGLVLTYEWPMPVVLAVGGTLALSIALMVLVDMPVDRWRQRRVSKAAAPAGLATAPSPG